MSRRKRTVPPSLRMDPGSGPWRDHVNGRLLDGYGVEDIAIALDCHADAVRRHVRELRRRGTLKVWFRRKAAT